MFMAPLFVSVRIYFLLLGSEQAAQTADLPTASYAPKAGWIDGEMKVVRTVIGAATCRCGTFPHANRRTPWLPWR